MFKFFFIFYFFFIFSLIYLFRKGSFNLLIINEPSKAWLKWNVSLFFNYFLSLKYLFIFLYFSFIHLFTKDSSINLSINEPKKTWLKWNPKWKLLTFLLLLFILLGKTALIYRLMNQAKPDLREIPKKVDYQFTSTKFSRPVTLSFTRR